MKHTLIFIFKKPLFCPILINFGFFSRDFHKFRVDPSDGNRTDTCGQTDK